MPTRFSLFAKVPGSSHLSNQRLNSHDKLQIRWLVPVFLTRQGGSWLVLQNNQELPEISTLAFDFGGFCLLGLLIRLKFFLRLRLLTRSLISETELAVSFAQLRIYLNRLLVIANGIFEVAACEAHNSQLKISLFEVGIEGHCFFE